MTSETKAKFEDAKVGDLVRISGGMCDSIHPIERVTATMFVAVGIKFRKSNGKEIGCSGWFKQWAELATPEMIAEVKRAEFTARCYQLIRHCCDVTPEEAVAAAKAIVALRKEAKNDPTP